MASAAGAGLGSRSPSDSAIAFDPRNAVAANGDFCGGAGGRSEIDPRISVFADFAAGRLAAARSTGASTTLEAGSAAAAAGFAVLTAGALGVFALGAPASLAGLAAVVACASGPLGVLALGASASEVGFAAVTGGGATGAGGGGTEAITCVVDGAVTGGSVPARRWVALRARAAFLVPPDLVELAAAAGAGETSAATNLAICSFDSGYPASPSTASISAAMTFAVW